MRKRTSSSVDAAEVDCRRVVDHLFTEARAAHVLDVAESTLADWRRAGAVPFLRLRGRVRYRSSDLQRLVALGLPRAAAVRVVRLGQTDGDEAGT